MSTDNICFHGKIRKIFYLDISLIRSYVCLDYDLLRWTNVIMSRKLLQYLARLGKMSRQQMVIFLYSQKAGIDFH